MLTVIRRHLAMTLAAGAAVIAASVLLPSSSARADTGQCDCPGLAAAARVALDAGATLDALGVNVGVSAQARAALDACLSAGQQLYLVDRPGGTAAVTLDDLSADTASMAILPCTPSQAQTLSGLVDRTIPAATGQGVTVAYLDTALATRATAHLGVSAVLRGRTRDMVKVRL